MKQTPIDTQITLKELNINPFKIYKKLRTTTPIVRLEAVKRTIITKAEDTRFVRENPNIFSSNDPITPMHRAFQAHTLMRKDGEEHRCERMAMMPAFSKDVTKKYWIPKYKQIAEEYVSSLKKGETVDLSSALTGPFSARGLAQIMGMDSATNEQMIRWSQALITGAGNFDFDDEPFAECDKINIEINTLLNETLDFNRKNPNNTAFSIMINANNPICLKQIYANIKVAIGGGINEPRDGLNNVIYGLLKNPEQLQQVKENGDYRRAFEEAIRWVAPISVSGRVAAEDCEIRGFLIKKGEPILVAQASANRDEDIYKDGEIFNVYRENINHQSFGLGPHFCMGSHIARSAICDILLPLLFERFPRMELYNDVDQYWQGFGFHSLVKLPVTLQ